MPTYEKVRQLKQCHVCGDVALSYNFCGISCESCRNFFRRTAYKYKVLTCAFVGNCHIDKETRRNCQKCRMDKCIAIGMKIELTVIKKISRDIHDIHLSIDKVPTSSNCADNVDNAKRMLNQKALVASEQNEQTCHCLEAFEGYSLEFIQNLCLVFRQFSPKVVGYAQHPNQVFTMQEFLIRNVINFGNCIRGFKALSQQDQLALLKSSFTEIIMFRSLIYYISEVDSFLMRVDEEEQRALYVRLDLIYQEKMGNLIFLHRRLANVLQEVKDDYIIRELMSVIIMFKWSCKVSCPEMIRYEYYRYRYLLKRYLIVLYDDYCEAGEMFDTLCKVIDEVTKLKEIFFDIYAHLDCTHFSISHSLMEIYEI